MSRYISDLAVAEFDRDVKREYTQKAQLRALVRVKTGIEGTTCRFQKSSAGQANRKVPQADVTPMNLDYSYVTATLEDWNAPEYTDIFDAPKVNFDEKSELVYQSAQAIARREDQLIIDAIEAGITAAGGSALTVAKTIGGANTMNTAKFRDAKRQLDYYNVPGGDRVLVMSSEALYDLLGDSDADTFDKNAIKALVNGEMNRWLGFQIYTVGYMAEGGLPKSTNDRKAYAFHKSCIGHAVGLNMRTEINYVPQKTSWLVNTIFSAGAVMIDYLGCVDITHEEQ